MSVMSRGNGKVESYRDLIVWNRAMDLVDEVYRIAAKLPAIENYGLRSQLTRAAYSVPTNVAEGQGRGTMKDFANFLVMARGSLGELETLLLVSVRQKYISPEDIRPAFRLSGEVGKMLTALRKRLLTPQRGQG